MTDCTYCDAVYEGPGHQHKPRERAHAFGALVLETRNGYWFSANGSPMPSWWSPERRTAFYVVSAATGKRLSHVCAGEPPPEAHESQRFERITADLETGAEVPV